MTAWSLYTLIARICRPASNPIVLFEREIWRPRKGPRRILRGSALRQEEVENVVCSVDVRHACAIHTPYTRVLIKSSRLLPADFVADCHDAEINCSSTGDPYEPTESSMAFYVLFPDWRAYSQAVLPSPILVTVGVLGAVWFLGNGV